MSRKLIVAAVLIAAVGVGIAIGRMSITSDDLAPASSGTKERDILYWVAPMDPNFRRDEPGKSPMGMDLVPVYADAAGDDPAVVSINQRW